MDRKLDRGDHHDYHDHISPGSGDGCGYSLWITATAADAIGYGC